MTSAWKRICSIGLVLCLLLAAAPMTVLAADSLQPEDFADTRAAAVQVLKEGLGAHESEITVLYKSAEQLTEADLKALFADAVAQNGAGGAAMAYLGDYLVFSVAAVTIDGEYDEQDGVYYYRIPYVITYLNDAEQEAVLREKVSLLTETMQAEANTDYDRCKWIYEYMRANIAGGADTTDWIGSTAYGALAEGKANAQGMAALFYVLASQGGLHTRIVTGVANGSPALWNIVQLHGKWYMLDAHGGLFLKGFASAEGYLLDEYYLSPEFQLGHVLSETDFVPEAAMSGSLENGKWSFDAATKTLTVSGNGPMPDFAGSETPTGAFAVSRPWDAYVGEIEKIVIEEGVTAIGAYAFCDMALTEVTIAKSVGRIGYRAFSGCDALTKVRYCGEAADWNAVKLAWGNDVIKSQVKNSEGRFFDVSAQDWFCAAVQWAEQANVTGGAGNGMFGAKDGCTRAQVVTFLWAAMGRPEPLTTENPFTDVAEDAWYAKAVLWAVEQGITGGVAEDRFGPDDTCTRGQIVTFLYAAAEKPAVEGESGFDDVAEDAWYAKAVLWAAANDVTGGIAEGKFGPNDTCTRAQVVTFLYKVYGNL